MSILERIFRRGPDRAQMQPLYAAAVTAARQSDWYVEGQVPDTLDGRFDMVAAMLSLAMLRLEADGDRYATENTLLTEIFVADMDGQLREIGIGDVVVGKHLGRMISALGGRLGAYRSAFAGDESLESALARNIYRGDAPPPAAVEFMARRFERLHDAFAAMPAAALIEGRWPSI